VIESDKTNDGPEIMAEYFDRLFGPVLSSPWAARLIDTASLNPGDQVLDVACGSGAVATAAWKQVGPEGAVTGLDRNPGMLAVARRKQPDLGWTEGRAEDLPFGDEAFDAVLCQFGLMFFENRAQALGEMRRVLRPGGRVAIAVWDRLERTPAYTALIDVLERHLGVETARPIRDAFGLGDPGLISSLLEQAGFASVEVRSVDARAKFPSLKDWVDAELKGWATADIDDDAYTELMADATRTLRSYEQPDGSTNFALPAVVGAAVKS
jgi:ubiquinone/menaquinone biosynthesis C-methylase UbiE